MNNSRFVLHVCRTCLPLPNPGGGNDINNTRVFAAGPSREKSGGDNQKRFKLRTWEIYQ